eukprot:TRINITY_DN3707_c0_g1_i1.p1 TRINITY_DN3707_c0_g1~~TRINITY_DN3707_c0_g1_i1.p1  ORF type:complete len:223 (-),score=48.61 TRINITY_DN3707_c0_g1_i1:105-773(-)
MAPGFLHISEARAKTDENQMYIKDMEETGIEVGSMLDVIVVQDRGNKIQVSLFERLAPGTKLKGAVTEIFETGAALDLEGQKLPGWLPVDQFKKENEETKFQDMWETGLLEVGSMLDVTVRKHKVKNSIEVTLLEQLLAPGTELKGKVTEIIPAGAVLDLEGQTSPGWLPVSSLKKENKGIKSEDMRETGLEVGSMLDVIVRDHRDESSKIEVIDGRRFEEA